MAHFKTIYVHGIASEFFLTTIFLNDNFSVNILIIILKKS